MLANTSQVLESHWTPLTPPTVPQLKDIEKVSRCFDRLFRIFFINLLPCNSGKMRGWAAKVSGQGPKDVILTNVSTDG